MILNNDEIESLSAFKMDCDYAKAERDLYKNKINDIKASNERVNISYNYLLYGILTGVIVGIKVEQWR